MILYSTQKQLSSYNINKLWSIIEIPEKHFTTSYSNSIDLSFLIYFYKNLIKQGMTFLGLENRVKYNFDFWYQCYNKNTNTHQLHDHFSGDEILSWVHVISTNDDKCFYYVVGGKKVYPKLQNDGDFFMFPSWLMHGVKQIESDSNRLIIAGNVNLCYYHGTNLKLNFYRQDGNKIITRL